MALILADRVKVRSRTTGLTDFTLENAIDGFQSFEAIGNGNTTYYGVTDVAGNWEIGIGTYTSSGPTLSRDTIISSSNNGAKVNFPVGSKNVFCTFPSSALQTVATGGFGNFEFINSTISTVNDSNITLGQTTDLQGDLLLSGGLVGPIDLGTGIGMWGADPTVSSAGGNILLQAGASYLESGGPSTNGGNVTISAGQGSNDVDISQGGNVNIYSGAASQQAGNILIEGGGTYGSSGQGGDITIQSGSSFSGVAGDILIKSGVGAGGGYLFEGSLTLRGKNAEIISSDGGVNIRTGDVDSISVAPSIWNFGANGNVTCPGDVTQSHQDGTSCVAGVDTVIYTSTGQYQHAIKLFVMVEGYTDGGSGSWDTQACDIIAVKGYNDNIIHVTAYGVTYSGASAIATFDGQWNATLNRIEITCSPISVTNNVVVSVHAIELRSND